MELRDKIKTDPERIKGHNGIADTTTPDLDTLLLEMNNKEDNGEEKNRSAYLLFYEKVDQSKCEQFDKIKILNII